MVNVPESVETKPLPGRFELAGFVMEMVDLDGEMTFDGPFMAVVLKGSITSPVTVARWESIRSGGTTIRGKARLFVAADSGEGEWRDSKGIPLEWKHISSLVAGESLEKEMWYSYPYYSFNIGGRRYRIRFWLVGPDVDCGIHDHAGDTPNFKELHLQLRGSGYMEVFENNEKIIEVPMVPGRIHCPFYVVKDGKAAYPPHQYRSGSKGSLFMVFEELCK